MEEAYLNIIKVIYNTPTDNIILNGKKLKAVPLRSGTYQGRSLTTFIQQSTGSPCNSNQTRKRNKKNVTW